MSKETPSNGELLMALHDRTEELHRRMDMQCSLMEDIINKGFKKEDLSADKKGRTNQREEILVNALKDTIDVLEQTRKSFKSKKLEQLRKKLTEVLID